MGRRLVLFPLPYVGHQNPMFELANALQKQGFSISIISTKFHSLNPATHPHFAFHFIDDALSESDLSQDAVPITNTLNKKCIEPFRECLSRIISNASDEEPVACLITDTMWHFTRGVADALELPRIVLRTGNISSFTTFFALPMLIEKGHFALRDKEPENLIPELPPLRLKDIPSVTEGDQSPFHELLSNLIRETKLSKGLIFNAIAETEQHSLAITQREFDSIPIFPIGPFHKFTQSPPAAEHQAALSWLDKQAPNSVLYVSFGSLASVDQAGFLEMARGLANSNQPFLWVVRSDLVDHSNGSSQLPDGFLEEVFDRGHIMSWAAQKEVLAHPSVGGFWTHCGWNSTLESICEGVPMICFPCFGDQQVNARYVCEVWEIGLQMGKGAKSEEVEKVIRRLMKEKEGEEMRERAVCMKMKANECLLPGGSSYKYMEDLVNLILSF